MTISTTILYWKEALAIATVTDPFDQIIFHGVFVASTIQEVAAELATRLIYFQQSGAERGTCTISAL